MALSAKPTDYTRKSSGIYVPTHLWMLMEGSGTSSADEGAGTALNLTLVNAAQWASDALGPTLITNVADDYQALSASGTVWGGSTGGLLMVTIFKGDSATGQDVAEWMMQCGNTANSTVYAGLRNTGSLDSELGAVNAAADDASAVQRNATTVWDQTWHFVAGKFRTGTSTDCTSVSIDGAAWLVDPADTLGSLTLNRYAIGGRAGSVQSSQGIGQTLASWAYESNTAGAYDDWDDAFISALYNGGDPWSMFLDLGSNSPLILPHRSSGGLIDLSGNFSGVRGIDYLEYRRH